MYRNQRKKLVLWWIWHQRKRFLWWILHRRKMHVRTWRTEHRRKRLVHPWFPWIIKFRASSILKLFSLILEGAKRAMVSSLQQANVCFSWVKLCTHYDLFNRLLSEFESYLLFWKSKCFFKLCIFNMCVPLFQSDYVSLKRRYESLKTDHESLKRDYEQAKLKVEVLEG